MNRFGGSSRSLCFFLVASGVFLTTLDSSMTNVALPAIMDGLNERVERVDMVVITYLAVISITLVFWGRLGDTLGKGRVYVSGMAIFGCGALLCGLSANLIQLVAARAVQACGAAMMMATGPAIIKLAFPGDRLGRMLGLIGVATSCGLTTGPVFSGMLLAISGGWRIIFLVHLPLSLLLISIALYSVLPRLSNLEKRHSFPFDWYGGIVWMLLVVVYIVLFKSSGENLALSGLLFAGCLFLAVVFWSIEGRVKKPILPLGLVRQRFFWTAIVSATMAFTSLFIVIILLPFYLTAILGCTPDQVGLTMMALPASLVICSPLSGWLYDRTGAVQYISSSGLIVGAGGVLLMTFLLQGESRLVVALGLGILGCGISIFLTPNSASVLNRVQKRYAGISSGILATARNFGMMSGAAIAGAGFSMVYKMVSSGQVYRAGQVDTEYFLEAMSSVFLISVVLLVVGSVVSLLRGRPAL